MVVSADIRDGYHHVATMNERGGRGETAERPLSLAFWPRALRLVSREADVCRDRRRTACLLDHLAALGHEAELVGPRDG